MKNLAAFLLAILVGLGTIGCAGNQEIYDAADIAEIDAVLDRYCPAE